eukprot:PITA_02083
MVKLSKTLPQKVKAKYINLLSSFADVFSWDYSDLKTYDINIIQHTITIKPNHKPFKQKLRRLNPKLLPSIEKEINRLYKSRIIVPIRFSEWISNLVPVQKKTDDRDKTAFTTPWGTFHYAKMPFALKNASATFQREMDLAFANEKDVFLVVYIDDLAVFSKSDEEHMYHLKIVFQKCRQYDLLLNPKKSLFAMEEGKLLGHIISKDGIHIDPAHVQEI